MLTALDSWDLGQTWGTFVKGTFHGVLAGVEIQKSGDDLQRYEELVDISQPDVVIETGTRAGGSALWFHRVLGLEVITIDIAPAFQKLGSPRAEPPYTGPGISWLRGSSIDPAIVSNVLPMIRGKRVMVSLDSDHHSAHVQAEVATWAQFVSPGCYLVVEDACFDLFNRAGQPDWARVGGNKIPEYGGTLDALEKSGIEESREFWRDTSLEGITPISHSPCGWWRKYE